MNIIELLELQQTLFRLRLELQKVELINLKQSDKIIDYKNTNYRLRKELRKAKIRIQELEIVQKNYSDREFEIRYAEFIKQKNINSKDEIIKAKIKITAFGYKIERTTDIKNEINEFIKQVFDYAELYAKESIREWNNFTN